MNAYGTALPTNGSTIQRAAVAAASASAAKPACVQENRKKEPPRMRGAQANAVSPPRSTSVGGFLQAAIRAQYRGATGLARFRHLGERAALIMAYRGCNLGRGSSSRRAAGRGDGRESRRGRDRRSGCWPARDRK